MSELPCPVLLVHADAVCGVGQEEEDFQRHGYANQEPTSPVGLGGTTRPTVRHLATNRKSMAHKVGPSLSDSRVMWPALSDAQ